MKETLLLVVWATLLLPQVQAMDDLPPGVPRVVNPDGSLFFIEPMFTTREFQNEALRLVVEEANKVAKELHLDESLPITRTNLTHTFISGFGFMLESEAVGNVTSSNYWYGVGRGYKFSQLTIANYDARCFEYRDRSRWPVSRIETNAAYQLATQWLAAAHMDVEGMNRDCRVETIVDEFWNALKPGEKPHGTFVPIYSVTWTKIKKKDARDDGSVADVALLAPTKTLLGLTVFDAKYISPRASSVYQSGCAVSGKATITTNWPVKPQYISAPGP